MFCPHRWECGAKKVNGLLTLLEPQSRFGDKALKFQVVYPRNETAVLKGLIVWVPKDRVTESRSQGRGLVEQEGLLLLPLTFRLLLPTTLRPLISLFFLSPRELTWDTRRAFWGRQETNQLKSMTYVYIKHY